MNNVTTISVGFEADILNGPMTGIGNYCFHLVSALIERQAELQLYGYSHMTCRPFGSDDLSRIGQTQAKQIDPQLPSRYATLARKASFALRTRLAKAPTVRRFYRELQARRFQRLPPNSDLDLFHAFRYVPFANLGVPSLPVVYDLSFVRYPHTHPKDRLRQLEKLPDVIEQAAVVQTISEFSKSEIMDVYGCSADKIVVATPAASAVFRPMGHSITSQVLVKFNVVYKCYFLAVGTLEPRKNLRTLIKAYAQLSPAERSRRPLLIVGNAGWGQLELPDETPSMISQASIRFVGSVPDSELRALYEGATALLFPSIYEGFGMPVVEALSCGTEVVHGRGTCMDEITRGHAMTVAATDVDAWTEVLRALFEHRQNEAARIEERIQLAAAFDWHCSAKVVMDAYRKSIK